VVTLTGTFQNPDGSPISNGTLVLQLSQVALVNGTSWIAPVRILVTLTGAGEIPSSTEIYGNDVMLPAGTEYSYFVLNAIGRRVIPPTIFIPTGSSYNFNS
jgi:hypothetical protein